MLLKIFLFLLGQLILIVGGYWTISRLRSANLLVTAWGFAVLTWYFYLLIWYGPTSVFAVLGKEYVKEVATHPWWLNEDFLVPSLLNATVLQAMPAICTYLLLSYTKYPLFSPWARLEPLLAHRSNLWFGILGTLAQLFVAVLFGKSWLQDSFDFSQLSLIQKSAASGFFIFTVGPQLALLAFRHWNSRKNSRVDMLIPVSIAIGIFSFVSYGQRTYAMFEILLVVIWLQLVYPAAKKIMLIALPLMVFGIYSLTSLQARVQKQSSHMSTVNTLAVRLVDDLAYRSHIANDSVVFGARSCVLSQLKAENIHPLSLLPMEIVSGFPAFARISIYPHLSAQRLEQRIGLCYRQWLRSPILRPDLSDSKVEYFIVAFSPFVSALIGSLVWLSLGFLFLSLITTVFNNGIREVAFMLAASAHLLILSTTPGEFVVFLKASLPYVIIFSLAALPYRIRRLMS